ncbi:metallophosphoesterase [Pseudenhygromyxa sp. WMMC2535]|uniref:metallophosphoesterase family protein n=1 Tax=Pseudenhygromyxa sp. WMMC2535 TaxID=2712867 RepID=UPI001557BC5C|nr:metallophosphoesterase family protein [Pseudenhygromyxa sp. WMMC2535]NVB43386.1 metallophosphoesterase [Pseudenhygromyxa sp. WMMC2535]
MSNPALAFVVPSHRQRSAFVPNYQGEKFCEMPLPQTSEAWPKFEGARIRNLAGDLYDADLDLLRGRIGHKPFVWPNRTLYFFSDVHADADAWRRSLIASGGVRWLGEADDAYELTEEGEGALFVVAGDCFDKGPSNLRLLRAIKILIDKGADVEILAGNHDLRTLVGLAYMGRKEPRFAHLFVRMGKKTMTLFEEIRREYMREGQTSALSDSQLHDALFPDEAWFESFPEQARGLVPDKKITKELARIREKMVELPRKCAALGMTLGDIHYAAQLARELFLDPAGEFHWFFERMDVALRWGSFLIAHAGVDDVTAEIAANEGVFGLNTWFHRLLSDDPFELYHGSVGSMFRTKYREIDHPFTQVGVDHMYQAGIYGIVHGHQNILRGQRVLMREGLLNFECDCSVDINTRRIEGLAGPGGATVIFRPDGVALAISADYPHVKVFDAARVFPMLTIV